MELLLVEDELGIRDALSSFLRMQGVEVHEASTVSEAEGILVSSRLYYLVTDQHLPDGTGCELIERFLENTPRGFALLSTANPPHGIGEWLKDRETVQLMPKPLRPARLFAWISQVHALAVSQLEDGTAGRIAAERQLGILQDAGLGSEEYDRCMIALLPFLCNAKLVSVRREGSRFRLVLELDEQQAHASAADLISLDSRRVLDRLGVDYWRVDREACVRIHVLVSMPWLEAADLSEETLDLSGAQYWELNRVLEAVELAKKEGRRVVNLASWHRTGLDLLGHASLIPDLLACRPKSDSDRSMLWSDSATGSSASSSAITEGLA